MHLGCMHLKMCTYDVKKGALNYPSLLYKRKSISSWNEDPSGIVVQKVQTH